MKVDIFQYSKMLAKNHINIIYNGPLWAEKLEIFADILQRQLDSDELSLNVSQSVFSVFIEQINNMILYSAEKEYIDHPDNEHLEVSRGTFILGAQDKTYYIQSGNVIKNSHVDMLKNRIDYLNTLDKKELRKYYMQQMNSENDNPESKGAGIGLIEIARRATSRIDYEITPLGGGLSYFTMYVVI
uniref:Uncharacterized protein n=1 Tax=uncultured bacterium contig00014 TaxID=1181505 RepID=A0A806K0S7_9BACT|nr:FIG062788: hypothetical protein [uncultured bacterium contig00014]